MKNTNHLILTTAQIRRAMKREGATITWLAERCDVSRSTMHRYIDKPGHMTVSVWATMVDALNIGQNATRTN